MHQPSVRSAKRGGPGPGRAAHAVPAAQRGHGDAPEPGLPPGEVRRPRVDREHRSGATSGEQGPAAQEGARGDREPESPWPHRCSAGTPQSGQPGPLGTPRPRSPGPGRCGQSKTLPVVHTPTCTHSDPQGWEMAYLPASLPSGGATGAPSAEAGRRPGRRCQTGVHLPLISQPRSLADRSWFLLASHRRRVPGRAVPANCVSPAARSP